MGTIEQSRHISDKKQLNHIGSAGFRIKILATPPGGSEFTVLEYVVDENTQTQFKFSLEEMTQS